jgi:hypothetical protein
MTSPTSPAQLAPLNNTVGSMDTSTSEGGHSSSLYHIPPLAVRPNKLTVAITHTLTDLAKADGEGKNLEQALKDPDLQLHLFEIIDCVCQANAGLAEAIYKRIEKVTGRETPASAHSAQSTQTGNTRAGTARVNPGSNHYSPNLNQGSNQHSPSTRPPPQPASEPEHQDCIYRWHFCDTADKHQWLETSLNEQFRDYARKGLKPDGKRPEPGEQPQPGRMEEITNGNHMQDGINGRTNSYLENSSFDTGATRRGTKRPGEHYDEREGSQKDRRLDGAS